MKAIKELLEKQVKLEKEITDLSNGQARVGTRENTIEIDTTGMSEEDTRALFFSATLTVSGAIKENKEAKESELMQINDVLTKVEELLNGESHV